MRQRKGAKTTRRKTAKKNSSFPHLEAASYAKIKDMLDVLSDDRTANIAKILCETSKTDAPVLLEVLTETKTRKRVAEFSKFVKELAGDVNAVAEHWGDGVDLSVVEKLKI